MSNRPPSKRLLKARAAFRDGALYGLRERGAELEQDGRGFLPTPIGMLRVKVYENWIATAFHEVATGTEFTRAHYGNGPSNPYSGKWNFHYTDDAATRGSPNVLTSFCYLIDQLLAYQPAGSPV